MSCKEIDMAAYKRRAQFDYFRSLAYPYAGVTVEVDISRLVPTLKMHSLPFFLPVLYCAVRAANSVPEFRQRIHGDSVVEYDYCEGSYTVALPDETYCYCVPKTDLPFGEFLDYTREAQRRAVEEPSIEEQDEADSLLFISCIPWVSQTAVVQTRTRASHGANTSSAAGTCTCRFPCFATMRWWTGCTSGVSMPRLTARYLGSVTR